MIRTTTATDFHRIRRLSRDARYRYTDYADEDLNELLTLHVAAIGEENHLPWGYFCVQQEKRPSTLAGDAPTRAYLRGIALDRSHPPDVWLPPLVEHVVARLAHPLRPVQIIGYGSQDWMRTTLTNVGFSIVDQVRFYELTQIQRRISKLPAHSSKAQLMSAQLEHLDHLAELDAAAFPPLWHFGQRDMLELLMRCQVRVATQCDRIVGYAALSANSPSEGQLARIAVHPTFQRQGIGRDLLVDAIRLAVESGHTNLVLNTQVGNTRSQHLYRSFGFHFLGETIPVIARTIPPQPA